jgi:hypothetical protein
MGKRCVAQLFAVIALLFCMASGAWAIPVLYDDFSGGLSDSKWDTSLLDGVSVENGVLTLRDNEFGNTFLFGLPMTFAPGGYQLTFDFRTDLASVFSGNTYVNDLFTTSLGFDTLLEVTSQGAIPSSPGILVTDNDWTHLTYDFTLTQSTDLDLWFTLLDNTTSIGGPFQQDSVVYLDNLRITSEAQPVPEPSTFALMGSVLLTATLLMMRRDRRG